MTFVKNPLICVFVLLAIFANAQTNKIISINLPTNLDYGGDFVGSRQDNTPRHIKLIAQWQKTGQAGQVERFQATIYDYPYIRSEWVFTPSNPQFPNDSGVYNPVHPIRGKMKLLSQKAAYNNQGEPINHLIEYQWVTNSP